MPCGQNRFELCLNFPQANVCVEIMGITAARFDHYPIVSGAYPDISFRVRND